ncbi:MAG: AmmeMemoRadiSam system protein B/AmmeMemoRadiSam system protein A [Alteromonas naphthalenivorans]|jgi:AmmeMemoRadiSam system protein B/AmmeMemoRadiSam system protein A
MKNYGIAVILGVLVLGTTHTKEQKQKQAHLSGWYQKTEQKLKQQLKKLDQESAQKYDVDLSDIKACIVPHAGFKYSGAVAASCFRLVDPKRVKRIIILAPSHHVPFKGIALPEYESYTVPNGKLKVDKKVIKTLSKSKLFQAQKNLFKDPHDVEHALEIELPLIVHYFKKTPIVPLLVGHVTDSELVVIAQSLKPFIDESTLVVASSDFTHYGPRFDYQPFKDQDRLQNRIKQLDGSILETIFKEDPQGFLSIIHKKEATVCGKYPIAVLLELIHKNNIKNTKPYLVAYATSQDKVKSDPTHSVSYAGVVFAKKNKKQLPVLTEYEKRELLAVARASIGHNFESDPNFELQHPIKTHTLKQAYGAFVTLNDSNNALRGCIGSIITQEPLYKTIIKRAHSAAFDDGRFNPLTKKELPGLNIKISVLSQPASAASHKDIVLGKHGIILKNGSHQAVFLPAVATDQGWSLVQTLEALSRKAGLSKNAWKDKKTKFELFQSIDFGEQK